MEKDGKKLIKLIPKDILDVLKKIEDSNFEAYFVGGCVRDLILKRDPKDWDITTNATPEEIIPLFEKTIYENKFGTVGVCILPQKTQKDEKNTNENDDKKKYEIIEVTPYRTEAQYKDFRHPEIVTFSKKIEDDLKRRDFKMNAIALNSKGEIVDLFNGIEDIKEKRVSAVGKASERFEEDALRMMRAVRFATEMDFSVSHETIEGIVKNAYLIEKISKERVRDEFKKIIMSENSSVGILMLQKLGILKYIIPELEEGVGCEQGGAHIYDVFDHLLHALKHASTKNWPLEIRLSALFHDIGKPRTRRLAGVKGKKKYTFYGHEVVGAKMAKKIMERLKFSSNEIDFVEKMVRNHMFFSDTEQITLSPVRRIIVKVGQDHIWDLMKVRECDRVGMNKKEAPYRLRKYFAMIEEALHDPISVKQLKIDGNYLIKEMSMMPGPRMGWILNALLHEVIENPEKNEVEILKEMVLELDKLSDEELKEKGETAKEKKEELEEKEVEKLYQKHNV